VFFDLIKRRTVWNHEKAPRLGRSLSGSGTRRPRAGRGTIPRGMENNGVTRRLVLVMCLLGSAAVAAQDRPLPDQESFLRQARTHLQTDASLQSSYMYVETRREQKLDKQGRVKEDALRVYENYPGLPGEPRWERLVAEKGEPVSAERLEKQDRDRRKEAEAFARRLEAEPARERTRQQRESEKQRREREEQIDDIFVVFDIRMLGREAIEGHDTIAFSLTPRPDAKPKTSEGSQMRKFAVRAWISESDHELVRLEAEAVDTLSWGLGLLARLHKGAKLSFLRRKVNGEVWLPAVWSYSGSARVGLFWMIRRSGTSEYSGYRKFAVDTATTFKAPQ